MKAYIIAATGTDIGKTHYIKNLILNHLANGETVSVIKPLLSGFINPEGSDAAILLNALGYDIAEENLNKISPWRFKAALAPNIAAKQENAHFKFQEVVSFCRNFIYNNSDKDFLYIETSGGVMSPLDDHTTMLDLMMQLNLPVILLAGNYLGAVSHILTSHYVLNNSNIKVEKIIINNAYNINYDHNFIIDEIKKYCDCELSFVPYKEL